ncbi:MAG: hypothetical protein WCQ49_01805 [Candidatus Saccharibacteria bacterium]
MIRKTSYAYGLSAEELDNLIDNILQATADVCGISVANILGKNRHSYLLDARCAVSIILHKDLDLSDKAIGKVLNESASAACYQHNGQCSEHDDGWRGIKTKLAKIRQKVWPERVPDFKNLS